MKKLFLTALAVLVPIVLIGQTQGTSLRATNGVAWNNLTIQQQIQATNASATNTFKGRFQQGTSTASGTGASAFGLGTISSGNYSFIVGRAGNNAGPETFSSGTSNVITSSGNDGFVWGYGNTLLGLASSAQGTNVYIEGVNNVGIGDSHIIEGGAGVDRNNHITALGRDVFVQAPAAEVSSNLIILNVDPAGYDFLSPVSNSIYLNAPGGVYLNGSAISALNVSNNWVGSFTGNGNGLTNIPFSAIISVMASNITSGGQVPIGAVSTNQLNGGFIVQTGDKHKATLDGGGLTNLNATNITGVLPTGTVAANAPTNGNVLMTDGSARVWSNAPSLAVIYGTGGTGGSNLVTGSITSTNTAIANTRLLLNGAQNGATGNVLDYTTNNVSKFSVDTTGSTTVAGALAATRSSTGNNAGSGSINLSGTASRIQFQDPLATNRIVWQHSGGSYLSSLGSGPSGEIWLGHLPNYGSVMTNDLTITEAGNVLVASALTATNGVFAGASNTNFIGDAGSTINGVLLTNEMIISTNRNVANTRLLLNGAQNGAAGSVINYSSNNVSVFNVDTSGNQTNAGRVAVAGRIDSTTTVLDLYTSTTLNLRVGVGYASATAFIVGGTGNPQSSTYANSQGVAFGIYNVANSLTNITFASANAVNTITATNGVFGASGSIMLTTNVSVAMEANTYTNVGNYDYTTVFGNVTAATDALTNGTAGRYYVAIHASFAGAGAASLYEGALFTNAVECTLIEWQRDVTTTVGSASASGILTLPANCRVEYKIKSPDAETATFTKLGLTMMGAN